MKLLSRLTNRYLSMSLVVMVFSGTIIYFSLSVIINRQLDERLNENLQLVEKRLVLVPETTFFDPVAHVEKIKVNTEMTIFSDTLIFNEREQELEKFRQISTIQNVAGDYYQIVLRISKIESEDLLATLALVTIGGMLLLWLILLLVTRRIAKSLWKPFFTNLKQIEQFSVITQKEVQLEETGITEFDQLNESVRKLTSKIISDFQNQKQFSEDVSHELQTPLAIISSRLESLLENQGLEEHAGSLNSIYTSVRRLSKLNNAMIMLRKIENNQFESEERTNLKGVLKEKLEEFSELIRLKELQLETQLTDNMEVAIPMLLNEILINNLISNSINHTAPGGKIKIDLSGHKLSICNTGKEQIPEPEKLFNRFYKVDPASQSAGLGLAIVKNICDLHGLVIHYDFYNNLHCFVITHNE